jgi:uncharacterized protein YecE (DUF72 family)
VTRDRIRIGCSGWNYAGWRNDFYPPRTPASRWLEHYAQVFDTVEVNSTFYRLARRDAVARWVDQTPPGFCFAVKASRYLTHVKRLQDVEQGIARFYEPIMPLAEAGRLGPVLWQLPGISSATTHGWPGCSTRSPIIRPAAIASSSATPPGSARRSTSCCAGTVPRW